MQLKGFVLSAIASFCLAGQSVAAEDPNLKQGMDHPKYETEATATKDYYVGQDGSKNHKPGQHNPPPEKKPTPSK